MKIKISTDSTADIPQQLCQELNISVLPLTIITEEREYLDGVDITPTDFYKLLESSKKLPVSSQVGVSLYAALFEQVWNEGYTDLIHVSVNSKGSGTYQAAVLSAKMFFEEHPEADEAFTIHIIDSKTYSMAYGMAVVEAAQMARDGAGPAEIKAHIRDFLENSRVLFIPLDLKYVKKSGRISPAAAFVGDAIGLKPLITFEDGEAKILSKARGEGKAISLLLDTCLKERKKGTNYVLAYGNNEEAFCHLKEACMEALDQPPMLVYPVGCIISINSGPNMIGILYRR